MTEACIDGWLGVDGISISDHRLAPTHTSHFWHVLTCLYCDLLKVKKMQRDIHIGFNIEKKGRNENIHTNNVRKKERE